MRLVAKQPSQMRQNASKTGRLQYCEGDKGMPNGWSFNWGSMTTKERAGLETRCVESLLVVCRKTVPLPLRVNDTSPPQHNNIISDFDGERLGPPSHHGKRKAMK